MMISIAIESSKPSMKGVFLWDKIMTMLHETIKNFPDDYNSMDLSIN